MFLNSKIHQTAITNHLHESLHNAHTMKNTLNSVCNHPLLTLSNGVFVLCCECLTFRVLKYLLSTLYTSLQHDLIKAKALSLVNLCFNRESKTYLCTLDKAGFVSIKKYDSYKCWTCSELCKSFTFLMENIYVQFEGMVYQQIVGFLWAQSVFHLQRFCFYFVMRGVLCQTSRNPNGLTS